jgi:hypothetical protein
VTHRGRALLRAWLPVVAIAELVGFVVPAVVGVVTVASPVVVSFTALVAAGAVEGALLGAGQVHVLRRALPAVSRGRWTALTSGAAALAYVVGLLPSTTAPLLVRLPIPVLGVLLGAGAVLLLGSIGTAQWLELRRHVEHAAAWIGITALAWLLGLGVFLAVAMPLWHPGQPVASAVLVGLGAGALMALVMAAVTGLGLVRLLADTSGTTARGSVPERTGGGIRRGAG